MSTEIFHSKYAKRGAIAVLAVIFALLIFKAGMVVGYHEARFSYQWGEHYYRGVMDVNGGGGNDFMRRDMLNGNGTLGKVVSVASSTIVVSDQNGAERTINIAPTTSIRQGQSTVTLSEITTNDFVAVIGSPDEENEGEITAELIRILPPPGTGTTTTSTTTIQ